MSSEKYIKVYAPDHPNASKDGQVREHVYVASRVLGRALKKGEVVHHIDNNPKNNKPENLLVCTQSYHMLIHARQDALDACGHAHYMKCPYCKEYDDPANMYVRKNSYQARHHACARKYKRKENPKTGPYKYGVAND